MADTTFAAELTAAVQSGALAALGVSSDGSKFFRSKTGPVTLSNSTNMTVLDYVIIPRSALTKNSVIEVEAFWNLVGATGNAVLNIQINQSSGFPAGAGGGNSLILSGNSAVAASPGAVSVTRHMIHFLNDLRAQAAGPTANQAGTGNPGAGNLLLSTFDFENNDLELVFAAQNPTASSAYYATLLGFLVKVL